jgi:hypothetical protein
MTIVNYDACACLDICYICQRLLQLQHRHRHTDTARRRLAGAILVCRYINSTAATTNNCTANKMSKSIMKS